MTEQDQPFSLTALVADPAKTADVPVEVIPALLLQVTNEQSRVNAIAGLLLARLLQEGNRNGNEDRVLDVKQAAERLGTTEDWLKRHRDTLPFTVRVSSGQIRYSAQGIQRFIAARMGRRK